MSRINTCRFCHGRAEPGFLIKYGTRAYAHPACYIRNKSMQEAALLPHYQRRKLEAVMWLLSPIKESES